MSHERQKPTIRLLTRRSFLLASAASAALAGCGGGSGGNDRRDGTYRYYNAADDTAASVTVDRDGRVTYWSLLADPVSPFADFGQTTLDSSDGFDLTLGGVTTFAEFRGSTLYGRTEDADDSRIGFDWQASRDSGGTTSTPPSDLVGTFAGEGFVGGLNMTVLMGVSRDGKATFFGFFEDPTVADDDFYAFEGLSIDRFGNGYDYFLDLYGDRIALRDAVGGVDVLFTFGPDSGEFEGQTLELALTDNPTLRSRGRGRILRGAAGLRKAVTAFQTRKAKRP